ncbi:hypothetical protein ACP4OV_030688 [Aristida adscensionis]
MVAAAAAAGSMSVVLKQPLALLTSAFFFLPWLIMRPARGGYGAQQEARSSRIDGRAVDQGLAYALMLAALLVTYIFH